jgi:hypothetical protein
MQRQQPMLAGDLACEDLEIPKIPTLEPALPTPAAPGASASLKAVQKETLTDSEILQVLESRRVGTRPVGTEISGSNEVAMLRPEDTNTRLVLREAVARNAAVSFAVQLQWSVQPIDVKSVPRHPIFSAYALYAAEGRRAGGIWFFLRLGFFNDAVSAKQVAQYLRGDFASAAVVPVSPQERRHVAERGRSPEASTIARRPA